MEIQIFDEDTFSSDDEMDINPTEGIKKAIISLDLTTGNWIINGVTNLTSSAGTGFDEAGQVFFDISILSSNGDADGDFLLDGWESRGFDADFDGNIDLNLPMMGANPLRKDLFLEIDCLADASHTHCPVQGAIQASVQSFANAPVNNVDGTTGIQLHIDIGNLYGQATGVATNVLRTGAMPGDVTGNFGNFGGGNRIPEAGNTIVDWDGATGNPGTNFFSLKGAPGNNFNTNRARVFRYFLFAHQVNARAAANDCTSGWAEGGVLGPGNDGIVSLGGTDAAGNPCWTTDVSGFSVGSQNEQAGTLLHEFGHNLGLDHGGNDIVNNKPNYLSVMNYVFQDCTVTAAAPTLPGGCDFSRIDLPDLNEVNPPGLDECAGLGGGLGLGPVNWDGDLVSGVANLEGVTCPPPNSTNVQANINFDTSADSNGNEIQDPDEPPIFSNLTGFEDWNSLRYDFRTQSNFSDGGVPPFPDEATPEIIAAAREALAELFRPVLEVDKTGPTDALPGDVLNFSIKVKNIGNGPALNTTLTDTLPDSTQPVFNFGTFVAAADLTREVSFTVPCSTGNLSVLTNSATATAEDMLGNLVSGSDSTQTTVHTPVLTLSKSGTTAVNAGEAITYTITYENIGSGEANNVEVTDILPQGFYYSKVLDLGDGPKPNSVTVNGDGTTMLSWQIGNLAANSGTQTIQYTVRPSLLFLGGESLNNIARLTFQNANDCTFTPLTASAGTTITILPPTRNPGTLGFWRNHSELWTAEILARIQATDQRYDTDGNGALTAAEVTAILSPGGNQPKVLQMQLLSAYFNLATRRINAATLIASKTADQLGLDNVAEAAVYAMDILALPVNASNRPRYDSATKVLDEINNNKSEVY